MKVPNCSYCGKSCEGQNFNVVEQGGERRMRHVCERCLIILFDSVLMPKVGFKDGPVA